MSLNVLSKKCARCKKLLPRVSFGNDKQSSDGLKWRCKPCASITRKEQYDSARSVASSRRWRAMNPERANRLEKDGRRKIKLRLIAGYGGQCVCCGETHPEFLTLEHINGGGSKHRKQNKHRGALGIYRDVIRDGFPPKYTILCMNCNWASRNSRTCPHKTEVVALATIRQ